MMSGHLAFVAGAYAVSALALAALVAFVVLDHRARQRDLAALEASGIRRRSERKDRS